MLTPEEPSTPCTAPLADDAIADTPRKKKWYLLMANPSKTTHLGTLLRCAAAFGAHQVLLVGHDKFNCQGSFGAHLFLDILAFPTWESVCDYLRNGGDDGIQEDAVVKLDSSNSVTTIGILGAYGGGEEIYAADGVDVYENGGYVSLVRSKCSAGGGNAKQSAATGSPQRSFPVSTRPFSTDVCFLLSKDKRGLPTSQAQLCSGFVHVPHLSFDDTEVSQTISQPTTEPHAPSISQSTLLDTATALSIVLHHFTAWAGYAERSFAENQKFVKDAKQPNRRRLCRVMDQKKESEKGDEEASEGEEMNSTLLWNEPGSQSSDY